MNLIVDQDRLTRELETLAGFSDTQSPAITRIVFSEQDLLAREWFRGLCAAELLDIREDAVGNTFARWAGSDPNAPAVGTGSHIDAIPHSGRFDGTVGVLGALEAIRALKKGGYRPTRSIELLLFTSEEPTRFGPGCLGSRLLAGSLNASAGETLRDSEGSTLNQVRERAGFHGSLESVRLPAGYYDAFVELHIEQGPLLERRGVPIGIVTAIAAPASLRIDIEGSGGHAGAVLMPDRRDAFLAAAEVALAVEAAAKSTGAIDTVGTTGVCDLFPRAINSIPSRAHMELDIRDVDAGRRDGMLAEVERACEDIAKRRNVTIKREFINRDEPATCDPRVLAAIEKACKALHAPCDFMVSRAYHDSLFMSRICPSAMIFIPCFEGMSHRPDEYASPEAVAWGAQVLAQTLENLSASRTDVLRGISFASSGRMLPGP